MTLPHLHLHLPFALALAHHILLPLRASGMEPELASYLELAPIVSQLAKFEGFRGEVYLDHLGHPTIGFGHKLPPGVPRPKRVTREAAYRLLWEDVRHASCAATRLFPDLPHYPLPVCQGVVHMVFQLGPSGVMKFTNLRKALSVRNWTEAANEALSSRWAVQTPVRAHFVARLFLKGNESPHE